MTLSSPCEEVIICHLPTFSHWEQNLLWSLFLYIVERLQLLLGYEFLNMRIFFGNNNQTLVIMWKFHPFKGSWVKCSTNQKYTHTYTPFGHFSKRQRPPPYPSPIVHSCGVFNVLPNMIKIGWLIIHMKPTGWRRKKVCEKESFQHYPLLSLPTNLFFF